MCCKLGFDCQQMLLADHFDSLIDGDQTLQNLLASRSRDVPYCFC